MTQYEPVIGLEVHVELNTKTKMFCHCSADYFGQKPNTHTCPVCLGLPGALPIINEEAIKKCMQIGMSLNCKVNRESLFERKNYFYPDLAKGYQVSQLRWPLNVNGSIDVKNSRSEIRSIRINRAHQEEDTGKLTHMGGESLIDFNRSGVPLVEIVTEPDFVDVEEIRDYAKQLQNIFRSLGVSNADMERGDMRLEANVSVRPVGQKTLPPYRVELKNINSFRFMVAAVNFEIERQIKAIESGDNHHQETRGWNEAKHETFLQRSKEEANDYRYFPEPDLPTLTISNKLIDELQAKSNELPKEREQKYVSWGLSKSSASTISNSLVRIKIFEEASQTVDQRDRGELGNFYSNQGSSQTSTEELLNAFNEFKSQRSNQIVGTDLEVIVSEVISVNEKLVTDYKSGNANALQAIIGAVMKKSRGRANPQKAAEILKEKLK